MQKRSQLFSFFEERWFGGRRADKSNPLDCKSGVSDNPQVMFFFFFLTPSRSLLIGVLHCAAFENHLQSWKVSKQPSPHIAAAVGGVLKQ